MHSIRHSAAHFAAFSFVDRIDEFTAGTRARGTFAIPADIADFRACLVAEAVGQLAAWVAVSSVDFRGRPVAALATETLFHADTYPGQTLELGVEIDDCDEHTVAYGGWAKVGGRTVIELHHCLGPMLPVAEFDSPDALRERFALLRGAGAPAGRFGGVEAATLTIGGTVDPNTLHATLEVPAHTPFFADHFPRRAVFPATLLLDAQMGMAVTLVEKSLPAAGGDFVPARLTNVKMRSFITPGQRVDLKTELLPAAGALAGGDRDGPGPQRVALSALVDGKTVATARVELCERTVPAA